MRQLLLAGICLMAAACSNSTQTPLTTPSATPAVTATPTTPKYAVETGADKLILRISTGGGLIAPASALTLTPEFALYGDGRIIVPGPQMEMFPAPMLPNLLVMRVTPAEIQTILAAADKDGLLGPDAAYRSGGIADAGTTTFVVKVNGATHRISADALMESGNGENAPDAAVRARLLEFRDATSNLSTLLGRSVAAAEAYQPASMRVFVNTAPTPDASATGIQILPWPLAANPATAGAPTLADGITCLLLSGANLTTFVTAAKTANALTVWTFASGRYSARLRPLYPDESGCAGGS
jgi:hypothetical protein